MGQNPTQPNPNQYFLGLFVLFVFLKYFKPDKICFLYYGQIQHIKLKKLLLFQQDFS